MEMSKQIRRRIFIVEQSASGLGGHHLEYALRIAESSGFQERHVAVSRNFDSSSNLKDVSVHPTYKYGYWDLPGKNVIKFLQVFAKKNKSTFRRNWKMPKFLVKNIYLFSTIKQPDIFFSLLRKTFTWPPKIPVLNLLAPLTLFFLFIPIAMLVVVIRVCARIMRFKLINGMIRKINKFVNQSIFYLLFLVRLISSRIKYKRFITDTTRFLKQFEISESDLLFFGTISQIELSALTEVLYRKLIKPKCIVILRREPHEQGEKSWNWHKISNLAKTNSVIFYADTIELSETFSDLFGSNVDVFPIPGGAINSSSVTSKKDYEISYFGDARSEKDFEGFSNLIGDMTNFSVFAQINHARDIQPGLALAIQKINTLDVVKELKPMDSLTYLRNISNSELVWVGYLGENYEKRSSGIFVEATIRGIPCLVTNGSWMHAEIYRNSVGYWEKALKNVDVNLLSARRGIVKILTLPNRKITLEFTLSTGVVLFSTGWSDIHGHAYVVLPLIHKSENFQKVTYFDSTDKPQVIGFTDMENQSLWIGGLVLNNSDRANLTFSEYQTLKPEYSNFISLISDFVNFHSEEKIRFILESVYQ
jgi:hypothetical protein